MFIVSSCKRPESIAPFPAEKLYILEYNYSAEWGEKPFYKFNVIGFCELDKNFNVQYAKRPYYDSNSYFTLTYTIPDSLKNKISEIIQRYPSDTIFRYQGRHKDELSHENWQCFIIQKDAHKKITIKFSEKYLPEDLKFIFNQLYKNTLNDTPKSHFTKLFDKLNQFKADSTIFPPPAIKSTIQFTEPVIRNK
jgi:hypothetical protein